MIGENGQVITNRHFKNKRVLTKEESQTESIEITPFPQGARVAEVEARYSLTINLGNFESAQIAVSVRLPCLVEELNEAYEAANKFANDKVSIESQILRDYIKSSK
jgi:hypothetical protein